MKPFIVLHGDTYYASGWDDYAGEADTLDEARAIADAWDKAEGDRELHFSWWEIIDLRTKECVLTRRDEQPPFDPRSP